MQIKLHGYSIDKKKRADGRWQGRYRDENGNRHSVYGKNYDDVYNKLIEISKNGIKQKAQKAKNYTVKEWLTEYIRLYKADNLRERTLKEQEYYAKQISKTFGKLKLTQLNPIDLQEHFKAMKTPRLRELQISLLNQALKKAVKAKLIKYNPLEDVEFKKHKSKETKMFTIAEQARFEAALENLPRKEMFFISLYAGLRPGELLALTGKDIDLEKRTISINKAISVTGKQDAPKNKTSIRLVPISDKLLSILQNAKLDEGRLFEILPSRANKYFQEICAEIGLEGFTMYSLRHTFATRCHEAGIADNVIAKWMGHSTTEITKKVYIHIQGDFEHSELQKLNKMTPILTPNKNNTKE